MAQQRPRSASAAARHNNPHRRHRRRLTARRAALLVSRKPLLVLFLGVLFMAFLVVCSIVVFATLETFVGSSGGTTVAKKKWKYRDNERRRSPRRGGNVFTLRQLELLLERRSRGAASLSTNPIWMELVSSGRIRVRLPSSSGAVDSETGGGGGYWSEVVGREADEVVVPDVVRGGGVDAHGRSHDAHGARQLHDHGDDVGVGPDSSSVPHCSLVRSPGGDGSAQEEDESRKNREGCQRILSLQSRRVLEDAGRLVSSLVVLAIEETSSSSNGERRDREPNRQERWRRHLEGEHSHGGHHGHPQLAGQMGDGVALGSATLQTASSTDANVAEQDGQTRVWLVQESGHLTMTTAALFDGGIGDVPRPPSGLVTLFARLPVPETSLDEDGHGGTHRDEEEDAPLPRVHLCLPERHVTVPQLVPDDVVEVVLENDAARLLRDGCDPSVDGTATTPANEDAHDGAPAAALAYSLAYRVISTPGGRLSLDDPCSSAYSADAPSDNAGNSHGAIGQHHETHSQHFMSHGSEHGASGSERGASKPYEVDPETAFCGATEGPAGVMFTDGLRSPRSSTACLNFYFQSWTLDNAPKYICAMLLAFLLAVGTERLSAARQMIHRRMSPGPARRIVTIVLHVLQQFMGYVVMLAAMTYSIKLLLSVVVGLMVGHFLFFDERGKTATSVKLPRPHRRR